MGIFFLTVWLIASLLLCLLYQLKGKVKLKSSKLFDDHKSHWLSWPVDFLLGGEDDDSGCDHIWGVLVTTTCVLLGDQSASKCDWVQEHPTHISCHLLAGYEQFNVQSNHLLLDESKVGLLC